MRRSTVLAFGLMFAFVTIAMFSGALAAQMPPSGGLDENDPVVQDAKVYAADQGVSLQEAVRRLRLQGPVGNLDERLAKEKPDAFAGLWI